MTKRILPCPFCGGDAEVITGKSIHGGYLFGIICNICASRGDLHDTEDQAIDAWNSRAAYEMDDWFYLPKPKRQLIDYTTDFSFDKASLKANATVSFYTLANAIREWQEESLNKQVVERICDIFKPERTCEPTNCDSGEIDVDVYALSCGHVAYYPSVYEDTPSYCPECGARILANRGDEDDR